MRIESSTIAMAASRSYTAEAMQDTTTVIRRYDGGGAVSTSASVTTARLSQLEVEGGTAVFTSSAGDGITREDKHQVSHTHHETDPVEAKAQNAAPRLVSVPNTGGFFMSNFLDGSHTKKIINAFRRLLEYLRQLNGSSSGRYEPAVRRTTSAAASGFRISATQAAARYRETMALVNGETKEIGDANAAVVRQAAQSSGGANGLWTRQTVQSGFVAGQENTAFRSKGTVVTADGRTIDFNLSLEMSRSFEAAYVKTSKEAVYTDPLVINMDDGPAEISDVSFYFDLNCDGVEEELSALDASSGFLALDQNGDGEINNGSELFGARTGDGFGELAAYDQDGNGWIDEGDDVYSRLKVWVKCGGSDAQLLSLDQADVGAIFLGSQSTQYSLTNSVGETGAMIRRTGLYLRESGTVGTVQHVDFKT